MRVMSINYGGGPDPVATIRAYLTSGHLGAWTGFGINSSEAAASGGLYGVGYVDSADAVPSPGLGANSIKIDYALYGDVNLDGLVNATDFAIFGIHFNTVSTAWDQGDFNYDNLINASDFALLGANFGKASNGTAVALPESDYASLDAFAA